MTVRVSVLMPIYKTPAPYLRMAIDSILGQTYKDFELLIMDDCPNDDRESIVKSYKDERIIYLKNKENKGISQARNELIDIAKGEYLAVMDHDDMCLAERFEKQVAYLDEHPDVGVVGCWGRSFYGDLCYFHPIEDKDIRVDMMDHCAVLHPTAMIRKSVLEKDHIRYEARYSPAEDYRLWVSLIDHTKFHNIPEVLFRYRNHLHNTTNRQLHVMIDVGDELRYLAHKKYPDLYKEYTQKVKKRMWYFFNIKKGPLKVKKAKYPPLQLNDKTEVVLKKPIFVHAHVYYPNLWPELKAHIQNISPYPFDLYVTMVEDHPDIQKDIKETFPNAKVEIVENRGFDVGPFVHVLNKINLSDYEYVVKLHTKGDKTRKESLSFLKNHGIFTKYLKSFQRRPLGITGSCKLFIRAGKNVQQVESKGEERLVDFLIQRELPILPFLYVAGRMFICRSDILRPVQSMHIELQDFEKSSEVIDPTSSLTHLMEKMFGYCAKCIGYECDDYVAPKWKKWFACAANNINRALEHRKLAAKKEIEG